jgi:uncharacterized membrane protein YoaK (UPF0700 family)
MTVAGFSVQTQLDIFACSMSDRPKHPSNHPLDILLLTFVAGSADALGYLNLGKVFTSNMTGNVVLMGIALSEGRGTDTGRSLFALLAFILGNCLGAWICSRAGRKETSPAYITGVIGMEAAMLLVYALVSALLPPEQQLTFAYPLIALLGLSMGLQAAAVYRLGTPGVTTTAITGTLTTLLTGLMRTINFLPAMPSEKHTGPASFGLQGLVILIYCVGAAISGVFRLHAGTWAGFVPAVTVLIVVLTRLSRRV